MALTLRTPPQPFSAPAARLTLAETPQFEEAPAQLAPPKAPSQGRTLYSDRLALFIWLMGAGIIVALMLQDLVVSLWPW